MDVLIENGKAFYLYPDGAPELHPSIEIIKDYDGEVEEGYDWDGKVFINPDNTEDTWSYAEHRLQEYPAIYDQLDDLFHAGAFSEEMSATIQAVKDKYPKV